MIFSANRSIKGTPLCTLTESTSKVRRAPVRRGRHVVRNYRWGPRTRVACPRWSNTCYENVDRIYYNIKLGLVILTKLQFTSHPRRVKLRSNELYRLSQSALVQCTPGPRPGYEAPWKCKQLSTVFFLAVLNVFCVVVAHVCAHTGAQMAANRR